MHQRLHHFRFVLSRRRIKVFLTRHSLYLAHELEVLGHVSVEYIVHDVLAHLGQLLRSEHVEHIALLVSVQQEEEGSRVVVL